MIEDIRRCSEGYVWLATWSGIYRFDGSSFDRYTPRLTPLDERFVRIEVDDRAGRLLALSHGGELFVLDKRSGEMARFGTDLRFTSMFRIDTDQTALVTAQGKVMMLGGRGGSQDLTEYYDPGPGTAVNDIFKDNSGRIYILCDSGTVRERELVSTLPAFCHLNVGSTLYIGSTAGRLIFINEKGEIQTHHTGADVDIRMLSGIPSEYSILMGSASGGIFRFSPGTGAEPMQTPFAGEEFRTAKGAEGELWLYSRHGSLSLFDRESGSFIPFYDSTAQHEWGPETRLGAFLCDSQNILWIAGSLRGLERVCRNDTPFRMLSITAEQEPSPHNSVQALFQASNGLNFIATRDAEVHVYDQSMTYRIASWPVASTVQCFTQDSEGTIWMGTEGDGLLENTASRHEFPAFRPRYYRNTPEFNGSNADNIHSLCTAPDGKVWIGSLDGGLSYLSTADGQRRFISRKNRLSHISDMAGRIRHVCMDTDGKTLYAAGSDGILACSNPDAEPENMEFRWFGNLRGTDIRHLTISASSGTICASSYGNGFLCLDSHDRNAPYKAYTFTDGMASNYVLSSVEDFKGNIWIVTDASLCRLNPQTGSIISYPADRIAHNMLFNEGEPFVTRDGTICLGTNCGVLYFNPAEISNSTYSPKLMVTDAYINGTRISMQEGKPIRLDNSDRLSLRVKAIDMKAPEKVMYSYSFTKQKAPAWKSLGTGDALTFDRLLPGTYTLFLRSTNADGYPAHNDTGFTVIVRNRLSRLLYLAALVLAAGIAAIRIMGARRKTGSLPSSTAPDDPFTLKFGSLLEANLDNADFSLDDMCREMGMSRNTLYDRCRSRLGTTPSARLSEIRLLKAAELLKDSRLSISQIAYMTGFNDSHYFSRAFRKRFGTAPSDFRNGTAA